MLYECCILKFLLCGRDGGRSGIGGIVMVLMVMAAIRVADKLVLTNLIVFFVLVSVVLVVVVVVVTLVGW